MRDMAIRANETRGMAWGFLGVAVFGLTLPVTRFVVGHIEPILLALSRSSLAGIVAVMILLVSRERLPARQHWLPLAVVALGVVFGFPIFATLAMQTAPASHGGVVLGALPMATAAVSVVIAGERPGWGFWLSAAVGGALVAVYSWRDSDAVWRLGDIYLLFAVISAAVGYAVGGKIAKELGGWQVICWALALSLPFACALVIWANSGHMWRHPPSVWGGFLYLALVSQLLGFFWWNKGLALGGVSRVSQTMLLQPLITLFASWLLLGEKLSANTAIFAVLIIGAVALNKQTAIRQRGQK